MNNYNVLRDAIWDKLFRFAIINELDLGSSQNKQWDIFTFSKLHTVIGTYHIDLEEIESVKSAIKGIIEDVIARAESLRIPISYNPYETEPLTKAVPPEETVTPNYLPEITKVHFNGPATVVFWSDGTKTIVKCQDGDWYSPEHGLAMAISKKALGNRGNFNEVFKKWLPREKTSEEAAENLFDTIAEFFRLGINKEENV